MATLKNRLGSLIAKPKMKQEDKKNVGANTQQTPPAQKSLPNQTLTLLVAAGNPLS